MSDDNTIIEAMRRALAVLQGLKPTDEAYELAYWTVTEQSAIAMDAALREIDRLRAKAAAYDALRTACEGVPELLDEAYHAVDCVWLYGKAGINTECPEQTELREAAERITAALAAAAPDADRAADADGGAEG